MKSTMQDYPLTVTSLYRRGRDIFGDSQVVTLQGHDSRRARFASVAERAERLAAALRRLGVREGDRVGTFSWNNQEHQEAYLAVPCMGAVLHTLNLRLAPEQLAWIVNHAEDRVIIVDGSLVPMLAKIKDQLRTVEHYIVTGLDDASALGDVLRYDDLIAREKPGFEWPDLDEPPETRRAWSTATARSICIRWRSGVASRSRRVTACS
jgi:fatty-acyl-CoA synthase